MIPTNSVRRLVVNADDFGRSTSINRAVLRAHQEGILTTASLMVNGDAFEEAVDIAKENPRLGVGLHLALVCGRSTLDPEQIPDLVNRQREFDADPVRAGFRYFVRRRLRSQLSHEMAAQFERFHQTGIPLDHVNGHLNLHLHPTIFGLLTEHHVTWKWSRLRWVRDPFWLNLQLASGHLGYRVSHAIIFHLLSRKAARVLQGIGAKHTQFVFGLLQNGRVDEEFIRKLLPRLPAGDSELYSHPCLEQSQAEFNALVSPSVRDQVEKLGIQLIRYQDL